MQRKFAARALVAQTDAAVMIVLITAKLHAAMRDVAAKTATITVAKWKNKMDYFLANPKPKPLTKNELLALFLEGEAKAKANSNNQPTKSCGCCPADDPKK